MDKQERAFRHQAEIAEAQMKDPAWNYLLPPLTRSEPEEPEASPEPERRLHQRIPPAPRGQRWCCNCQRHHPIAEFGRDAHRTDKLKVVCRESENRKRRAAYHRDRAHYSATKKAWRARHPNAAREYMRQWRESRRSE